jgi:hypothetical protein
VIIIPLVKRVKLKPESVILLSLEAVLTSIFNIIFFYALTQAQLIGVFNMLGTAIQIALNLLIGVAQLLRLPFLLCKQMFYCVVPLSGECSLTCSAKK